jgi:hypothetical protein
MKPIRANTPSRKMAKPQLWVSALLASVIKTILVPSWRFRQVMQVTDCFKTKTGVKIFGRFYLSGWV